MTNKDLLNKYTETIMKMMASVGTGKELEIEKIANELEKEILIRMEERTK